MSVAKITKTWDNRLHRRLGVVLKTNDEIYVLISIGKYIITFHLFSVLYQRWYCCRFHLAKEQILQPVLNIPCCFLEKRTLNFSKYLCQLFFAIARLIALWICDDISIEILSVQYWTFTCFSKNGHKSNEGVKFVQT